ncbi:arsenate-mycothiol transferase ArsC [Gelidibacter maritimus]|uniref:Protein-tyrosine-phosphatase n=1 Tax=Gelidibacter maritimus TaxID=2761487 RepID=A0A7W2R602_9FLAO|nr:protein-tyrosine-phosphatase [Gelidibacter maritimus]MBA6154690.1 protein-tyrosine-phosphatase [Gelidibacter maritimus]
MTFSKIESFIAQLKPETLAAERKTILQPLVAYIQAKADQDQVVNLHFICTHNSRRSHLSQVWAQTMAHHFQLKQVFCYSGGTESTALFPMVVETLRNSGFQIAQLSEGRNPIYSIKYAANAHPIIGFSKRLDDDFNPESDFAAIMTCDSANEACPFVPGSDLRIPITYADPKAFDDTPQQAEKYQERSLQIATELFYVFSQIESHS